MKRTKKFVAGVSAMAMMAAMTTTMMTNVDAASLPNVKSSFSYELTSEMISDTQLEVTFQVTNNPGTQNLSLAFHYTGECTLYRIKTNVEDMDVAKGIGYNADENLIVYAMVIQEDAFTGETETFENFSISFFFNVDADETSSCSFSTAVLKYVSGTEGTSYASSGDYWECPPETAIQTYPYVLGDVDNDDRIAVEDASDVYSIVAVNNAVYGSESAPVSRVNYNVEYNVVSTTLVGGYTIPWNTRFSYLVRSSGYAYAEAADVDKNGYIEKADGDAILDYYANSAAAIPMETLIGTRQVKTVTVTL
jgi:hypothetical protein